MHRSSIGVALAVLLGGVLSLGVCAAHASARPDDAPKDAPKPAKVDLNKASLEDLMALPGVGEVTAKKIIAGRPYKAIADLSGAGLGDALIEKLTPLVMIAKAAPDKEKPAAKPGKPDVNAATLDELMALPGVGEAYGKKIIAGRPYKAIGDLSKAGLPDALIEKLTPLVTVGGKGAGDAAAPVSDPKLVAEAKKTSLNHGSLAQLVELPGVGDAYAQKIVDGRPWKSVDDLTKTGLAAAAVAKLKPLLTLQEVVWVNLDSKIFHRPSSRWFGKTKEGVYLLAADAAKAGYREAGETDDAEEKPPTPPPGMGDAGMMK